jgi:hypothetical protein
MQLNERNLKLLTEEDVRRIVREELDAWDKRLVETLRVGEDQ